MENNPHILITGGSGFVGSILTPMLLEKGYQVRVLDNLLFEQHSLLPHFIKENFEFIKGDIREEKTVKKALEGVNFIVHLAALVGVPACERDPKLCYEVNLEGTELINELRSPDQKLLFASTGSIYGKLNEICTEESPVNPLSDYGKSKLQAEQAVQKKGNYVIYRFATAFGLSPKLRLDLLPNDFAYYAAYNRPLVIYEADSQRTFIHVRDMARSFIFAIENFDRLNEEIYNVGSDNMNFTKKEIAEMIKEKKDFPVFYAEFDKDPDQRDYEVSYQKINKLGFKTEIGMDKGITELLQGYQTVFLHDQFSNLDFRKQ